MSELFSLVDLSALALLVTANSMPVILARLPGERYSAPIDAGIRLPDGQPLFGSHKTWRGLIGGVIASAAVGAALSCGALLGAIFGALALSGDLCSSFLKRRLRQASGHWVPLLDQLPEALAPLLVLQEQLDLTPATIIGTCAVFTALDLAVTKVRFAVPRAAE